VGSAGECRAQTIKSFKRRQHSRKNAKQVRDQREFRSYVREESPDRADCIIGIDWLDAILISGSAHLRLSSDCCQRSKHSFRAKPLAAEKHVSTKVSGVAREAPGYEES
jgi:hypothetical protein